MSHSFSGVSSAALLKLMPALLTAMSSPPNSDTTVSTILHTKRFYKQLCELLNVQGTCPRRDPEVQQATM